MRKERNLVWHNYFVEAPQEINLPSGSKIMMGCRNDASDFGCFVPPRHELNICLPENTVDVFPAGIIVDGAGDYCVPNKIWRIRNHIKEYRDKYDYVVSSSKDIESLKGAIKARCADLPVPFFHEPLEGFTVCVDNCTEVDFVPAFYGLVGTSKKPLFVPEVDFMVHIDQRDVIGRLGLVLIDERTYAVGMYLYQEYSLEEKNQIMMAAWKYFDIQYAFYVCPELVVQKYFAKREVNDTISFTRKEKGLNVVKIRNVIRARDFVTLQGKRRRHTDCWYQRGTICHSKNGTSYFRSGCYKGPERDNLEARKRVKKYVPDTDVLDS